MYYQHTKDLSSIIWFWILLIDLIVLTVYGKLPPTGVNAYIGFVAAMAFILIFVAITICYKIRC